MRVASEQLPLQRSLLRPFLAPLMIHYRANPCGLSRGPDSPSQGSTAGHVVLDQWPGVAHAPAGDLIGVATYPDLAPRTNRYRTKF